MPNPKAILAFAKAHPIFSSAVAAGTAGVVLGASSAISSDASSNLPFASKALHATGMGLLLGAGGALLGAGGTAAGRAIARSVQANGAKGFAQNVASSWMGRRAQGVYNYEKRYFQDTWKAFRNLPTEAAAKQGYGVKNAAGVIEPFTRRQAIPRILNNRPGLLIGGGALIGAGVSAMNGGDPLQGAMLGAGAGVAAKLGLGIHRMWPGMNGAQKALSYVALAGGAFALGNAMTPAEGAGLDAEAEVDGMGYTASDLHTRMQAINANGNVVLGLNGMRHG